ncbi:CheR family methyltransferase [Spirochaeta lutea]|uniref:protein-glutamate O-methyltransferase n=1 Tax=Spirochaeta lutea TaxID=1480694 RepID=A0A098QZI2_9SPIO|nr:protein-glutamate O-methyltransferase CheR [Spirochaeta lutea]KGE71882.1 chemotaxis protein CheR [Spirochaeta lutea]
MAGFLTDSEFDQYKKLIYDASGITFSASNRSILESRLRERLKSANLDSPAEYYRLLTSSHDELKTLLDSVTTNLTRFFRNTAHIQTFEYYVIPELIKQKQASGNKTIKLWSAGCSTGEEPYTLAMVLKETLPADFTIQIVASDISLKSLMIGKEGFYGHNKMAGVPQNYLSKYFDEKPDGFQVKGFLKDNIRFDYHNLKHDSGLRGLDVVFCRNVLIYFDAPAQKSVIDRFWECMAPKSFLFIGHSESLFGMDTQFEFLKTDWACIYQKKT